MESPRLPVEMIPEFRPRRVNHQQFAVSVDYYPPPLLKQEGNWFLALPLGGEGVPLPALSPAGAGRVRGFFRRQARTVAWQQARAAKCGKIIETDWPLDPIGLAVLRRIPVSGLRGARCLQMDASRHGSRPMPTQFPTRRHSAAFESQSCASDHRTYKTRLRSDAAIFADGPPVVAIINIFTIFRFLTLHHEPDAIHFDGLAATLATATGPIESRST